MTDIELRALFEQQASANPVFRHHGYIRLQDGGYLEAVVEFAFQGWKMARESGESK